MKVAVTGASGFVGQALVRRLGPDYGQRVVALTRTPFAGAPAGTPQILVPDVQSPAGWDNAFRGVDVVVHTAARVHVMRDGASDPLAEYRKVNLHGTCNVASHAAQAGVRRFVFISSIKVHGERTSPGLPFRAGDTPAPQDPYGQSKLEAEQALRALCHGAGMELVVIRPPLVYGPGVGGNFATLMRWVRRGWPLPLGAVNDNRRSLVALDNLVDLIATCVIHPAAADHSFLASDGHDLSTTQLLRNLAQAMNLKPRLIPVPAGLIRLGASAVRRPAVAQRLCDSLQVDISATRQRLGWVPPISVAEALRRAAT